jgi:hypothetical protein
MRRELGRMPEQRLTCALWAVDRNAEKGKAPESMSELTGIGNIREIENETCFVVIFKL